MNQFEVDGYNYEDINCDGIMVYKTTYPDGLIEYSYSYNENVYCFYYYNERLVKYKIDKMNIERMDESVYNEIISVLNDLDTSFDEKCSIISETGNGKYELLDFNSSNVIIPRGMDSVTTLNIGISDLMNAYPEQNQAYSSSYQFYCPTLSKYKDVIIRDTRNNYIENTYINRYLSAGLSVAQIAGNIMMGQADVFTFFNIYLSANTLIEALNVNRGISARSSRLRQGFVYDTTYNNAYVSVHTEYGNDQYTVSNQGSGYAWGEVPYTLKDLYPDNYIGSESATIYNSTLATYGYWKWGNI